MDNEKIVKRVQFPDYGTFLYALNGKRFDLLRALRPLGKVTVTVLATHIKRPRAGVLKDLGTLVAAGFVDISETREYSFEWDKLTIEITLGVEIIKVDLLRLSP